MDRLNSEGVGIGITFSSERFFLIQKIRTDSVNHADSWDFKTLAQFSESDFENFAQFLKLRRRYPYTWLFHTQNQRIC